MSKCVVLGITGSIAAYKAAEITSRLKRMVWTCALSLQKQARNL